MNESKYSEAYEAVKAGTAVVEDYINELSTSELERLEMAVRVWKERKEERKKSNELEKTRRQALASSLNLVLSPHAVERVKQRVFRDRSLSKKKVHEWFAKMLSNGNLCRAQYVNDRARFMQGLGHNWEKTDYFIDMSGNVYVVVSSVVKTVHHNEAKRFVRA